MNHYRYPDNRTEANAMLRNYRDGKLDLSLHLVRYCLLMTGDLT